jgi:Skp family chaperone for outer membrane proteins
MAALFLALISLFSGVSSASIELSLESNRVKRGNIGYVDMEVLFKKFPETIQAKKKFKADIQKAEDQINLEKIGVLHLRQDLSELRMERRYASKENLSASTVAAIAPIPSLPGFRHSTSSSSVRSSPTVAISTTSKKGITATTGPSLPISTTTAKSQPLLAPSHDVSVSSEATVQKSVVALAPESPTPTLDVALSTAALAKLNTQIAVESEKLIQKKETLKQDESSIEKNLLNLESQETEGLLGKIYKVIREVASESG